MGAAKLRVLPDGGAPMHESTDTDGPSRQQPLRARKTDAALIARLRQSRAVPAAALSAARTAHLRHATPVDRHLIASGVIDEPTLLAEYAAALDCAFLGRLAADAPALDLLGADFCLAHGLVPVGRRGGTTLVAASRPDAALEVADGIAARLGRIALALAPAAAVEAAILGARRPALTDRAEARVAAAESCRGWSEAAMLRAGIALAALVALAIAFAPGTVFVVLSLWAIATLALSSALKIAAAIAAFSAGRSRARTFTPRRRGPAPRPEVSILVPLFREREIAGHLLKRLALLTYPQVGLEFCLITEEDVAITRAAVARAPVRGYMRRGSVAGGGV
jgi:hypothetical protein